MKPPKKIFIQKTIIVLGEFQCGTWGSNKAIEDDVEYVLAPVWHDAKEPPEEIGVYLVEWRERPYLWEVGYWNGNCWDSCHWKRPFPTQPTRYRKGDLK
jgi:hypothetical protein